MSVTFTNEFHKTEITLKTKDVGNDVSLATVRRVKKALCGISDCPCSGLDGTRNSEFVIVDGRDTFGRYFRIERR